MDSNSFGVAFLFTAVGVGINMYWTLLDDGKTPCPPGSNVVNEMVKIRIASYGALAPTPPWLRFGF